MQLSAFVSLALCGLAAAIPTNTFNPSKRIEKRSFFPGLQNTTCVLSPEVAREDYVANPPVRQDVTDGQSGLSMILDIGVMDTTTCKALPNVMVEIWSPNAQGNYGSFLRGATLTGSNGIAEFDTIFPGFTSEGANHINVLIHQGSSISSPVAHVGQLFFTDRWTEVVSMTAPYNTNTNKLVVNAQDSVFKTANSNGYNSIIDIESIQDDWPTGVSGYITVGINPHA